MHRSTISAQKRKKGLRLDSRNPLVCHEAEIKSQMPYHYTTVGWYARHAMLTFEFFRFRFGFRALDSIHFPAGKSANVLRGAFGTVLRQTAPLPAYQRLFEPRADASAGPSGLRDWPRPFLFRTAHLDGQTISPGETFFVDAHVFDLQEPVLPHFRRALSALAESGLGPRRGRAELQWIEQLDLEDHAAAVTDSPLVPSRLRLADETNPSGVSRVAVRFFTPTELKSDGESVSRPDFPVLFARLRDRLSTLRALYGNGPLEIDFQEMGRRAAAIRLDRCDLHWEHTVRRSTRTGQTHPIGGFTGEAEYTGELAEFLPWIQAGRWIGVGRQTVWGKGDIRVTGFTPS